MVEFGSYKIRVEMMLSILVVERIEDFRKRYKLPNRSEALKQLVDTALLIENKLPLAEKWTSKDIADIKESLAAGQIVDYLEQLPRDKFSLIYDIIQDEQKIRRNKKH